MIHLQKKDVKENALNNIQVQIQLTGACTSPNMVGQIKMIVKNKRELILVFVLQQYVEMLIQMDKFIIN